MGVYNSTMPDYEARVNTKFGVLVLHFNDKQDLDKRLEGVSDLIRTIEQKLTGIAVIEDQPVSGLEGICTVTSEGLPKLLMYPETDSDKVRLALYASPRSLSSEEITRVTGVRGPTALRFMKFDEVIKSGGKFALSGNGRNIVTTKILP